MRTQLILSLAIAGAITAWMVTGDMIVSGTAEEAVRRPPAERTEAQAAPFRVRVKSIEAEERPRALTMRGRTRADALVTVAAETAGRVDERPVDRGTAVEVGDVLCRIDEGVRQAQLAQAKAEAEKAELDFAAASKLRGRGFESDTRVAATKAARDAAVAVVAAAEQELARTIVTAPIAGIVQDPLTDVGSVVAVGGLCATIVDADPIVVTGQVSEREIPLVSPGVEAEVRLLTGETVNGTVHYVSSTANTDTRTFTVEIRVPNSDRALRDGVTAEARIPLPPITAHRVSPGVLTLDDAGQLGVRTVDAENRVSFAPVKIVTQDTDGFWVSGLPETVKLITVGQDYVVDGQLVDPVAESEGA
ncbi:efflux RND transporter periplasmic adaptor subunit [Acuticoccus sp. M5D2P5]|uniref:efflux RND transporter periplasmic adaptor subunit n=1 Tax=Acuticoccus kalidii TaxID=2910977 RepID=UPI001F2A20BE|nr:efflux RND transporter periplasmic adaptor subunit [Acuticoccus kalidii]MCF3935137.1 efflux RND transporter periplasmic adaptor subunit [Acuticoccus kalidii]